MALCSNNQPCDLRKRQHNCSIVMLYAYLEVHKGAEAACLLQKHRSQPRPDFDSVVRIPEERADDLRWANAV